MKDKPIFWAIMTILAEAVLIAVLIPSAWLNKINEMEYGWMESTYSESSLKWLDESTDDWHYTITRQTGLADWMHWMFFPSEEARAREKGMSRLGEKLWFPYIESRGKALDDMLKTFLMRIGSIFIWLPLILLVAVPSAFEGFMERGIKQHTFKYPSPFMYRYGVRVAIIISFLIGICLLSPLPIPPLVLPIGVMLTLVVMGLVVVGNLPKRL